MTSSNSQGVYSPLPQSLSDSDSEKEMPIVRPKFSDCHTQNGVHENVHHNGYIRPLQLMKLPEVRKVTPAMSPKRKFCFVFSIAICLLTIVVFLWVLPCSESGTCPVRISNWENQHDGVELTGRINAVRSAFKNTLNLALFFKRNLNSPDSQSGVISVLGNNGAVAWYVPQVRLSTDLNCYLIDVNGDDINDCLVLGEMGLEAIDPVSGGIFWHAHNHSQSKTMNGLDFPMRLQDLNHDNINELLATKNSNVETAKFVIISGKTGALEGEISVDCSEVQIVEMNSSSLVYTCKNENHSDYHEISVNDLLSKILNRSQMVNTPRIAFVPKAPNGYVLNGRRLLINNVGQCPTNCRVEITLLDEQTNRVIKPWSYQNSYAFTPASFSFKPTKSNLSSLKGHVNGFILKLWEWFGYDKRDKRRRFVAKRYVLGNNATVQVNSIMERVVLITFNNTDFHIINASLTEITQLCFPDDLKFNCQPSLENQNNSLLISDLDMDGSQELVSYSSTFVRKDEAKEKWQLVSNMKVIRLEAELPKLYEVAK